MPPKIKITKEEIVQSALELIREGGEASLNARNIAKALDCSTQPIFSNFATMDELHHAVLGHADAIYNKYIQQEIKSGKYPPYKASGMAYIRFAKEEKELFKLLYMRDRTTEGFIENSAFGELMDSVIKPSIGLDGQEASLFHLEMWAYVHGIATMFATGFVDLDW